jgi:RNA polymerase sigma factor (sigma-70 family)
MIKTNEQRVFEVQNNINVKENMERLFIDNRGFIVKIIQMTLKSNFSEDMLEDFVQGSYFSLVKAVEKFDTSKGNKFISYWYYHIKNQLLRHDLPKSHLFNNMEISIDEPITNKGGEDVTISGCLKDDSMPIQELAEKHDLSDRLWECVDRVLIDESLHDTIIQRFKYDRKRKVVAENQNSNIREVNNQEKRAIRHLRNNKDIKKLGKSYWEPYWKRLAYRSVGSKAFNSTWTSSTEKAAFEKIGIRLKGFISHENS